ncbi:cache domain-containing sensor histidine kinase [Bacillus horti]|uniref:histidine kinase n=1 Tax=Caldalkalibacillus horti TaxID=77523 RepID=A0ABT9VWC9_9BACI|nr:sensor histidine kinase [Bacillus horti]MDQ0165200.1 two-component system sensor histidine kinase YesM [Bacillus horti]
MKKWLYRLNLNLRLLLYFSFVITIAIVLVTWMIYLQSTYQIKEQVETYLEHIVENTSYQTDRYIHDYELATLSLLTDTRIKRFLDLTEGQSFERYTHYREIKKKMSNISLQYHDINLIYIIGEEGQAVLSEDRVFSQDELFPTKEVYEKLYGSTPESGKIVLSADASIYHQNQYVITITRKVRGMSSFAPKGILGIEIKARALADLWNIAHLQNNTSLWILGPEGEIVYHSDESYLGQQLERTLHEELKEADQGSFTGQWGEEKMLFYFTTSPYTNWKLVAMTPEKDILEPISGIKNTAISVGVVAFFIAILISSAFTKSIVKPLRKVQKGMKRMEQGEWERIPQLKGNDEISSVVESYNKMVDKLSQLVDDLYKSELKNQLVEIEKQRIELQALQSQINPHFLHNTLETMNAYAIMNEADEISEMAEALSSMFRYSVRNLEVVTLLDELNHVKNFLVVQEHRFQKKMIVSINVSPELYEEEIVKLTLQPIIENAIHHGLRKMNYEGVISITASVEKEFLLVQIQDNGVGISMQRMEEIQRRLASDQAHEISKHMGIGVSNVDRRIKLVFGQEYGLRISSSEGEGTNIQMRFPRSNWLKKYG